MFERSLQYLQGFFGYPSYRKNQEPVVKSILKGDDTLAIMPTGGGKSICYQIPALCFDGITIVISPLISLMKDQVDSIIELGISAAFINSTLSQDELSSIIYRLSKGKIKILYVAPERLDSRDFLDATENLNISQIAIDEAHCVSQWGHDFRPSYKGISRFISKLPKRPVITAFTATATSVVQNDIINLLSLKSPNIFVTGFDRDNLLINCLKISNKMDYIKDYINANKNLSGIIYASTRKEVNKIYEYLKDVGISCGRYHAGLLEGERKQMQEDFVYDKINLIVATNAFGMGIDKSNVRYVIHYNMPKNIEGYYQEIGRAGRDGENSECILLFSPQDVSINKYLIEVGCQNDFTKKFEYEKLQYMVDFVHHNGCLRKYILTYFGEEPDFDSCNNCSSCLNEGTLRDKTIDAQKVLSCIYRMKKEFGTTMVVDVLRGSSQKKVLSNRFDSLSTYGIMKDYSKNDLVNFINTLVSHGFLSLKEGEFPVLKLNSLSGKVLKGEEKVILKEFKVSNKISSDNGLFDRLKVLRLILAKKNKIPPYFIFSDTTLKSMSISCPKTPNEMLQISGVGENKLKKYGDNFIKEISLYLDNENLRA
ncbi:DNA helicase RecQ, partial [Clostridium cylindrosporum]|uniref:DNA helicase RecQ n=1 Tax=Clostridium cylindrosporum DSM 605 TaxID=1121307 RepID=A0A0J8D687_CLOCY